MDERKMLRDSLGNACWGFALLSLDINLGNVSILPAFAGWLLLASASEALAEVRRDLRLLTPLCYLLAAWNLGDWLLSWAGKGLDGHILFLDLLVGAAGLYFRFQFLTDMAELAGAYWEEGKDGLSKKFLFWRTAQTLLATAAVLCGTLLDGQMTDVWSAAVTAVGIAFCAASVMVVWHLICLRDWFREEPDAQTGEEAGR